MVLFLVMPRSGWLYPQFHLICHFEEAMYVVSCPKHVAFFSPGAPRLFGPAWRPGLGRGVAGHRVEHLSGGGGDLPRLSWWTTPELQDCRLRGQPGGTAERPTVAPGLAKRGYRGGGSQF